MHTNRSFGLCLLLLVLAGAQGCSSISYYTQAARGHFDLMGRRVPIATVLDSDEVDSELKDKLRVAVEARQFASTYLLLPDNDSYRTYADLERDSVLWNVFATKEFSTEAETWCYWFVGCLGYRGYFDKDKAHAVADDLNLNGYDAFVGGVAAYSTLGRFDDPVLNTMLDRKPLYITEIMFHELAHQKVYRAGDSEFSESLASFIQEEGVFRWLQAHEDADGIREYELALSREQEFTHLLIGARQKLTDLFASELPEDDMRLQKQSVFSQLQLDYQALKQSWDGYSGFDRWFARDLNNAHLVSVSTYHRLIPAFRALLQEENGDLAAFYARVEALASEDDETLHQKMEALLGKASKVR